MDKNGHEKNPPNIHFWAWELCEEMKAKVSKAKDHVLDMGLAAI